MDSTEDQRFLTLEAFHKNQNLAVCVVLIRKEESRHVKKWRVDMRERSLDPSVQTSRLNGLASPSQRYPQEITNLKGTTEASHGFQLRANICALRMSREHMSLHEYV